MATGAALQALLDAFEIDIDAWEGAGVTIPSGNRSLKAFSLANPDQPIVAHPDALDRLFHSLEQAVVDSNERIHDSFWLTTAQMQRFAADDTYQPSVFGYENKFQVAKFPKAPSKFVTVTAEAVATLKATKLALLWTSGGSNTGTVMWNAIVTPTASNVRQASPDATFSEGTTYNGDSQTYLTVMDLTNGTVTERVPGQPLSVDIFRDHTDGQNLDDDVGLIRARIF